MNTKKTQTKYLAVVTYCIALVCLLLGFFLPFFNGSEFLFKFVPGAFSSVIGQPPITTAFPTLGTHSAATIFGATVDLYAWLVFIYSVVVVLAVIALIPMFVCGRKSKAPAVYAYVLEIIAAVVLTLFVLLVADEMNGQADFKWHYNILIALGGTVLMFIIQSIGHKKGSGVMKTVMYLLSAVALFALVNVPSIIPSLPVNGDAVFVGAHNGAAPLLGFDLGAFGDEKVAATVCLITAALVLINYVLDLVALSTNTNKGGSIFNLVRYALELIAAVVLLILCFVNNSLTPGVLLYVVVAVALIQVLISVFRMIRAIKKAAAENEEVSYETDEEDEEETYGEEVVEVEEGEAPVVYESSFDEEATPEDVAPVVTENRVQEHHTVVYTVSSIYRGPTDSFIAGLTEEEKIEFSQLFLEKIKGNFDYIPDYVVGGNNAEFFSAIFIYLGRFRGMISDGLMDKIYKQL